MYNRNSTLYRHSTFFSWAQPIPAYIGLIGCFIIVFIFTSATWWDTPVDFTKVANVYGAVSSLFSMRLSLNIDLLSQ